MLLRTYYPKSVYSTIDMVRQGVRQLRLVLQLSRVVRGEVYQLVTIVQVGKIQVTVMILYKHQTVYQTMAVIQQAWNRY